MKNSHRLSQVRWLLAGFVLWTAIVAIAFNVRTAHAVAAQVDTASANANGKQTYAAPFAFADFSWIPGNYGASERPLSFKAVTGEFRTDVAYHYSFNRPQDDTISG